MLRWVLTIVLIVLITLVFVALTYYAHQTGEPESGPPPLSDLTRYFFNSYFIGYLPQVKAVPVVLIFLFSQTQLFWRVISHETVPGDNARLFFVLVGIQSLTISYEFGMAHFGNDPASFGLLVAIFAGLLGGWPYGLAMGMIVMFFRGTLDVINSWPVSKMDQAGDWLNAIRNVSWGHAWLWNYLGHMWAAAAMWAGVVAGLIGLQLGARRFSPLVAAGLAVGIYAGAGWLIPPLGGGATATNLLFPAMQASALALGAFMLMIRSTRSHAAQRRAEAAEFALAVAELRALRAQINPHFLFNALTTIRYIVRTDPDTARRLPLNLSQVLQRALRSEQLVSLQDEIAYVKAYLSLEQARLNDRLHVNWELPSDNTLEQPVPALILQSLVENAVLHGIAPQPHGGCVTIAIAQMHSDLVLRVIDDGCGVEPQRVAAVLGVTPPQSDQDCIGLRNIDGRLRALFGDAYGLVIDSEIGHDTLAEIRIPLTTNDG